MGAEAGRCARTWHIPEPVEWLGSQTTSRSDPLEGSDLLKVEGSHKPFTVA